MIIILATGKGGLKEIKLDVDDLSPALQAITEAAIGDGTLNLEPVAGQVFKINLRDIVKYILSMIK
ncbi:hypothetical protein [Ezakiella peruensis]|uniref:hypothetical protein n=1 Tax=Ezakiella peruensis TaxID=1464038 RepID=UPI000C1B43E5|nr:hypothetical protein [Ezakiella peruensis]